MKLTSVQLKCSSYKARILCKLHICFYDAYRQNFGFSGRINKFLMKLRHLENAYFAYFKHLEHILGKMHISAYFSNFADFFLSKVWNKFIKIKKTFLNLWSGQF
jgi:hypothetical protein